MNDCIFCKIISGEIPSHKVYEDDDVFAFLDIHPVNPGHVLVVPKRHAEDLQAAPDELLAKLLPTVKKIAAAAVRSAGADGFNLGMNNGAAAGQVVFHAHLHVIPRFADDGLRHWGKRDVSDEEMRRLAEGMRGLLA